MSCRERLASSSHANPLNRSGHALGIPTDVLNQVRGERLGYDEEQMKPASTSPDTALSGIPRDSPKPAKKPHPHAPGQEHHD